ncbi:unnamed protein product [Rhizophagus irregularis]|nr:unnamed protein product [Rhizophagus irregularis]CAB4429362.1 unnamed protein product [Rhizophagus irregularis]CAB4429398.1 unnamed protein product [Rhizophagus irregularis]
MMVGYFSLLKRVLLTYAILFKNFIEDTESHVGVIRESKTRVGLISNGGSERALLVKSSLRVYFICIKVHVIWEILCA